MRSGCRSRGLLDYRCNYMVNYRIDYFVHLNKILVQLESSSIREQLFVLRQWFPFFNLPLFLPLFLLLFLSLGSKFSVTL